MTKKPNQDWQRYLGNRLSDEERCRCDEALAENRRAGSELEAAALAWLAADPRAEAGEAELPPADPALRALVRDELRRLAAAEYWCLESRPGAEPYRVLAEGRRVEATVRRLAPRAGGGVPTDTGQAHFPVTIERLPGEPPTLRLASDVWPRAYELTAVQLVRFEPVPRVPWECRLPVASPRGTALLLLAEGTADATGPGAGRSVVTVKTAADTPPPDVLIEQGDFCCQCRGGEQPVVQVRTCMPLDRREDYVVAELAEHRADGRPFWHRTLLRVKPSPERGWSQWKTWSLPEVPYRPEAEVPARLRSLGGEDLYLLPGDKAEQQLAAQPHVALVADRGEAGFQFAARGQREALADPAASWILEVKRIP